MIGDKVKIYDSTNCIVNIPNGKKALIQGLNDYIIVESNDTLMIIKKEDEQKIKEYSAKVDKN